MSTDNFKNVTVRFDKKTYEHISKFSKKRTRGNRSAYLLKLVEDDINTYETPLVRLFEIFCPSKLKAVDEWCGKNILSQESFCDQLIRNLAKSIEENPNISPSELLGEQQSFHYPILKWEEIKGWLKNTNKREIESGRNWAVSKIKMSNNAFVLKGCDKFNPIYGKDKYLFCDIVINPKKNSLALAKTTNGEISMAKINFDNDHPRISFFPFSITKRTNNTFDYIWKIVEIRSV